MAVNPDDERTRLLGQNDDATTLLEGRGRHLAPGQVACPGDVPVARNASADDVPAGRTSFGVATPAMRIPANDQTQAAPRTVALGDTAPGTIPPIPTSAVPSQPYTDPYANPFYDPNAPAEDAAYGRVPQPPAPLAAERRHRPRKVWVIVALVIVAIVAYVAFNLGAGSGRSTSAGVVDAGANAADVGGSGSASGKRGSGSGGSAGRSGSADEGSSTDGSSSDGAGSKLGERLGDAVDGIADTAKDLVDRARESGALDQLGEHAQGLADKAQGLIDGLMEGANR